MVNTTHLDTEPDMNVHKALLEFHHTFNSDIAEYPATLPNEAVRHLRIDLLEEEFDEYCEAEGDNDIVGIADALADIVYIAFGTAVAYGINLNAVLHEVHRSNMSKVPEDGKILYREDGKILKPDTYSPPNIAAVLGVDE